MQLISAQGPFRYGLADVHAASACYYLCLLMDAFYMTYSSRIVKRITGKIWGRYWERMSIALKLLTVSQTFRHSV